MKTAAVFALRTLVLTLVLIIVFMIAINVAGMAQVPLPSAQVASTPAAQAQQAASLLGPLLAYTFLVSLVTAWIIQSSRWRGLKLIAMLVFSFYGLMTFIIQIESIVYLRAKMPPGLLYRDGNAVDAAVSVRAGTAMDAVRVSRGQDVEHQEN